MGKWRFCQRKIRVLLLEREVGARLPPNRDSWALEGDLRQAMRSPALGCSMSSFCIPCGPMCGGEKQRPGTWESEDLGTLCSACMVGVALSPWLTFPEPQFLCLENRPITQVLATAYPGRQRWFVMTPFWARGRFINPSDNKSLGPKSVQLSHSVMSSSLQPHGL